MIFVNKRDTAESLKASLAKYKISSEILIGSIDQAIRDKTIDSFRKEHFKALICTNVLARGIDVPEVDLVINLDIPYLSRFGF